jgi:acetyltransferase-like isoleucine patch superfamily enzyme
MRPVVLPILDANMTHGVVRAWFKREGDTVRAGEALFEVETDKVNAEVEAEADGLLRHIAAPVGTRVPVLGIVAFIGAAEEAVPPEDTWSTLAVAAGAPRGAPSLEEMVSPSPEPTQATGIIPASPAARRLARERGMALERLRGTGPRGEITRADVEAASAGGTGAGMSVGESHAHVDPTFLQLLRTDPDAFRRLSSETKVRLYREHGAQIGEAVRIEPGAIVIAAEMVIGGAATIGADSAIECDRLYLGRLAAFGRRTRVRCRSVEIGEALWSKEDVVIGGGGSEEAGARLRAGDACFFGEGAYLNTCHPVTLGDEVCIGSRAMLFTHSHWQSILRNYPALFGPIDVGDHVFIGNNAFIFPGVRIAAAATVMVNSFVAVNVPAATLVGGVPAQVIRHVVAPTRAEQLAIVRDRLIPELAARLTERGYVIASSGLAMRSDPMGSGPAEKTPPAGPSRQGSGETTLTVEGAGVLRFTDAWDGAAAAAQGARTVVLTFIDGAAPAIGTGVTLFDLAGSRVVGVQDGLSDEVREFLRRRGIRFRPFAWRYGVGHFDGDRFCERRQRTGQTQG